VKVQVQVQVQVQDAPAQDQVLVHLVQVELAERVHQRRRLPGSSDYLHQSIFKSQLS
jgi:hypothetical protein